MRIVRPILSVFVVVSGLALAGCESFDMPDWFSHKKPLPGDRKLLFPEGVPGVTQGVPPEYRRGAQQANTEPLPAAEPAPEEKPKPKPQRAATRPKPAPQPAPQAAQPAPAQAQPQQSSAPWPAPQQPAARQASPWPSQSQSNQSAQPAWPAPGTSTAR